MPLAVHRPRRPEGNLQAWARDQRYAEATRLALERDADVAAGHTASDQVETVLYRLAASPGRRALLGMRERDGRLVRPLLAVWRAATEAWCAEAGLPWREDPSNASDAFARNRARHGLVPALRELHPAAERNVLRTLELLRDEAEVLDAAVTVVLDGGRLAAVGSRACARCRPRSRASPSSGWPTRPAGPPSRTAPPRSSGSPSTARSTSAAGCGRGSRAGGSSSSPPRRGCTPRCPAPTSRPGA